MRDTMLRSLGTTRRYGAECGVVATLAAIWAALLVTGAAGERTTQAISNVGLSVIVLAAAAGLAHRSRRHTGRLRRVWFLLALSAFSWGAGQTVWTWYESVLGREVPFPSPADIGYLGAVPLAVAALLSLPA